MKYVFFSVFGFLAFISSASANAGGGGFDVMSLLPIFLIFIVFYFLLLRPQQKKAKAHQELLGNLRRGDKVITSGGIIGIVQKTTDTEVVLEIAEGVRINVVKQMISEVMAGQSTHAAKPSTDNVTALPKVANKQVSKTASKSKKETSAQPPKKTKE